MAAEKKSSIAFFSTYRPPVPLDIFSCWAEGPQHEQRMTDGDSYNYNGQVIPQASLKTILKHPKLASEGSNDDVDSNRLSGMVFVSERKGGLETLHISLIHVIESRYSPKVKVFSFSDVFGTFGGVRMEDSGCLAGDYLIYVTTKDPAQGRRQPWTAVYKTDLNTCKTDRLTPRDTADLSPSVSPSGKKIAVASFEERGGWTGEIEDLKTDIFVMDVENGANRTLVVRNGGWPTWGSNDVIFFHRKVKDRWGVFRADIRNVDKEGPVSDAPRVTPDDIDAMTPAAIDATTVAVATIRKKFKFTDVRVKEQYRHIEIFDSSIGPQKSIQITQKIRPKADHFNPFVVDAPRRIVGYHRCVISDHLKSGGHIPRKLHKLESPHPDVGLLRMPGVFPTFSNDGSKLAFVDNEFKALWIADKDGLRHVFNASEPDRLFSPVWNKKNNMLYVCMGPSFNAAETLHIHVFDKAFIGKKEHTSLTGDDESDLSNNAFPSTSPDGTKIVFRSTRGDMDKDKRYKNLYIMDAKKGYRKPIQRLTEGHWTDTHCQWSPNSNWIVFSSDRNNPTGAQDKDNDLDPGYFAVFLVKSDDKTVVVRVMQSGRDISGHVNHPCFNHEGNKIVVTSDLAAVSVDPISLPLFVHSVRPYGDIFTFDINTNDIKKRINVDMMKFNRITHSRYENATAIWTEFSAEKLDETYRNLDLQGEYTPSCPYVHDQGAESWHMTGHLCIEKSCC